MANVKKARKLLHTVGMHLEAFNMREWVRIERDDAPDGFVLKLENIEEGVQECGTTLCLAGFAGLLSGHTVTIGNPDRYAHAYYERDLTPVERERGFADSWCTVGRGYLEIESENLTAELFYTSNYQALAMLADLARGISEKKVLKSFYEGFYYRFAELDLRLIANV